MIETKAERQTAWLMGLAPVEWEAAFGRMSEGERGAVRLRLEAIAERSAELALYADERHGYGCGDQGHDAAIRAANKAGRIVHCKVFGYSAFRPFTC